MISPENYRLLLLLSFFPHHLLMAVFLIRPTALRTRVGPHQDHLLVVAPERQIILFTLNRIEVEHIFGHLKMISTVSGIKGQVKLIFAKMGKYSLCH